MQYESSNYQSLIGIKGFEGTSLIDFPDRICSIIFIGGCNFRCPFCQNPELVDPKTLKTTPNLSDDEVIEKLQKRKKFIDGVAFTGGEPLVYPKLRDLIRRIKHDLGLAVKLDTNGYMPDKLQDMLENGLLDYVAMDVKAAPEDYPKAVGLNRFDIEKIKESIRLIMELAPEYEFRTTAVPTIVNVESMHGIGQLVKGAKLHAIQHFRPIKTLSPEYQKIHPYPDSVLEEMALVMQKYVEKVEIR